MKCPADGTECDALWCCKDQCLRQMAADGEAKAREMRAAHPFYRAGYEAAKAEMADKGHAIDTNKRPFFMEPRIREIQQRAVDAALDASESGLVAPPPTWHDVDTLIARLYTQERELVALKGHATGTNDRTDVQALADEYNNVIGCNPNEDGEDSLFEMVVKDYYVLRDAALRAPASLVVCGPRVAINDGRPSQEWEWMEYDGHGWRPGVNK